jgi:phosphatidylserine/phosphatidylglycerophosphate/cardiolipin synthase-like enzyme
MIPLNDYLELTCSLAAQQPSTSSTNPLSQFNPEHRHDEEHEKACDEKRTKIGESHRFDSYFPERDGNMVKWYVDGRDYFWVCSHIESLMKTIVKPTKY